MNSYLLGGVAAALRHISEVEILILSRRSLIILLLSLKWNRLLVHVCHSLGTCSDSQSQLITNSVPLLYFAFAFFFSALCRG